MEQTSQRILRIVSIDPGINLGLACLEFNVDTNTVTALDSHTVVIDNYIKYYLPEMLEQHGTLLARTYAVGKVVSKYCSGWIPDFLAHETAFSSHGRSKFGNSVESFANLRENILAIKLGAVSYDSALKIVPVNPQTVKYAVIGKQNNDKADIAQGLQSLTDLVLDCETKFLDQHGWDAIAIGYTFVKKNILGDRKSEHSKRNKRPKRNKVKRVG